MKKKVKPMPPKAPKFITFLGMVIDINNFGNGTISRIEDTECQPKMVKCQEKVEPWKNRNDVFFSVID